MEIIGEEVQGSNTPASTMDFDLPDESKRVIRDILRSKDRDGNGDIDSEELEECLMAVGFCPSPDDVQFLRKHFDTDELQTETTFTGWYSTFIGDGTISIDEIMDNLSVINMHSLHSTELMDAFNMFDVNKDGYIGQGELVAIFMAKGPNQMTKEEAVKYSLELFKKYDKNFDRKFNYPEFVRMFADDALKKPK